MLVTTDYLHTLITNGLDYETHKLRTEGLSRSFIIFIYASLGPLLCSRVSVIWA